MVHDSLIYPTTPYTAVTKDVGQVSIYAKQYLNAVKIDVKLQEHPAVENVFIRVQSKKLSSVTIGCMYRHPKADSGCFYYITKVVRNMCLQKRTAFILGDLNDNLLAPNNCLELLEIIN